MAKLCKRMKALNAKVEANKLYTAVEALELIKETAVAKFDESVDVAVQLGIDPRKSDQAVRGAVVMPEGTGKTVRVAVFTQGAKAEEAPKCARDVVLRGQSLSLHPCHKYPDAVRNNRMIIGNFFILKTLLLFYSCCVRERCVLLTHR